MAGEALGDTSVSPGTGLPGDRQWAVRDPHSRLVVTAKRDPRILFAWAMSGPAGTVSIGLPGVLDPVAAEFADDAVSAWLGHAVELVPWAARQPGDSFDFGYPLEADAGSFADEANLVHIVSTATLAWLAERAGHSQPSSGPARRLRPNLVIEGPHVPFAEDGWVGQLLDFGDAQLLVTQKTVRCNVVDQAQPGEPAKDGLLEVLREERGSALGVYASVVRAGRLSRRQSISVVPSS